MKSENVSGHYWPFFTDGHAILSGLFFEHDDSCGLSPTPVCWVGTVRIPLCWCLSLSYLTRLPGQVHLTYNAHKERNRHYPPENTSSRCPSRLAVLLTSSTFKSTGWCPPLFERHTCSLSKQRRRSFFLCVQFRDRFNRLYSLQSKLLLNSGLFHSEK